MKITIIGLGLVGGSLAKDLKARNFASHITGVESNRHHREKARELQLADEILPLDKAIRNTDMVILATPVNQIKELLPYLLGEISNHTSVTDMGSTKQAICQSIATHKKRKNYVAAHPIAGTENTGPAAAIHHLFDNKLTIICEKEKSGADALHQVKALFQCLKMKILFMDAHAHDKHIAYISHLSHITSFALGKTVLEIEKNEKNIVNMAGSGFASTVRLAKSSPSMWAPIFEQNAENIIKALDAYIKNLVEFRELIENKKTQEVWELMKETNEIRRILDGIQLN